MNRTRRHMLNAALAAVTLALGFGGHSRRK